MNPPTAASTPRTADSPAPVRCVTLSEDLARTSRQLDHDGVSDRVLVDTQGRARALPRATECANTSPRPGRATVRPSSEDFFFFFNNPAPPEFSPFPLPAPLPIGGARHDSHRSLQVLEVDMTGMACGPKAAFATKGYFAHQRHRRGRQRGRVLATSDGEMVVDRSEEHTSELQSQSNLVCRLLLEKK